MIKTDIPFENTVRSFDESTNNCEAILVETFIELTPVRYGHWEDHHAIYIKQLDAYFVQARCSCCGKYSDKRDAYSQYLDLEYCSHCGAYMRKEANNG